MTVKAKLHFAMMCNHSNGGYISALTLIDSLAAYFDVCPWSLFGELYRGHQSDFDSRNMKLQIATPAISIEAGDHVIFYMNEYPTVFANYSEQWREALQGAATVQIAFNRTFGRLPLEDWLAQHVQKIYFQDNTMLGQWQGLTQHTGWSRVSTQIMPPPVDIQSFLAVSRNSTADMVIGRLAGDAAVANDSEALYRRLSEALPQAQFWFMPAPLGLARVFADHPQFRFFAANEISVLEFFTACQIYLLTYQDGIPIPGPRSLVEAMAAGCAPVVVNRDGPKERVEHGVSGFVANNDHEFFDYVVKLAQDMQLRQKISAGARERANRFTPQPWVKQISQVIHSKHHASERLHHE
jgi:hypothetical protein